MRVLVTGALGFTGQAVARRLLAEGHEVVALSSSAPGPNRPVPPGASLVTIDLRSRPEVVALVGDRSFDAVCHLAALTRVRDSLSDPIRYFDVNLTGTLNLLAALETSSQAARFVFCSTGAVYGLRDGTLSENEPALPANPYGASKLAAEQAIGHLAATGRLGAVTLRCFNIAGAVDGLGDPDLTRIIPKTLAVAAGAVGMLSLNGDGRAIREYTHVLDVATAFSRALTSAIPGRHLLLNVGSGVGASLAEVVRTAERVTGRPIPVEHHPPTPEAQVLMADSSRIQAELGWKPSSSSLEQIVADAWAAVNGDRERDREGVSE